MAFAGLVPSERSSGNVQRRGRITKSGSQELRRVLVEAAWPVSEAFGTFFFAFVGFQNDMIVRRRLLPDFPA